MKTSKQFIWTALFKG